MKSDETDLPAAAALTAKDFGNLPAFDLKNGYEALRDALAKRIEEMLSNEQERLINAFYRIDVDERQFNKAFAHSSPEELPIVLAELALRREMQKAASRRLYGGG